VFLKGSLAGPGSGPDLDLAQLLPGLMRHTGYLMVSGTACGLAMGLAMRCEGAKGGGGVREGVRRLGGGVLRLRVRGDGDGGGRGGGGAGLGALHVQPEWTG
jgi:hypothetical protein